MNQEISFLLRNFHYHKRIFISFHLMIWPSCTFISPNDILMRSMDVVMLFRTHLDDHCFVVGFVIVVGGASTFSSILLPFMSSFSFSSLSSTSSSVDCDVVSLTRDRNWNLIYHLQELYHKTVSSLPATNKNVLKRKKKKNKGRERESIKRNMRF